MQSEGRRFQLWCSPVGARDTGAASAWPLAAGAAGRVPAGRAAAAGGLYYRRCSGAADLGADSGPPAGGAVSISGQDA